MADILVIDDDSDIIHFFKFLLEPKGHNVICASNSQEAVRWLNKKKFSIIFLDIIIPGVMGNKLGKKIKEKYPGSKLILMSSVFQGLKAKRELVDETDADDFLAKPLTEEAVFAMVSKHLSKELKKKKIKNKSGLIPVIVYDEDIEDLIMGGTFVSSNFNIVIIEKIFEIKDFIDRFGYGILILDYYKSPTNMLKLVKALSKNYPDFYIVLTFKEEYLQESVEGVNYIIHKPIKGYELSKMLKIWEESFEN